MIREIARWDYRHFHNFYTEPSVMLRQVLSEFPMAITARVREEPWSEKLVLEVLFPFVLPIRGGGTV